MNTPKNEIIPMFSVPLGVAQYSKHIELNEKLSGLFRHKAQDTKQDQHGFVKKNKQVFESEFNLFDWKDDCVQELQNFCWAQLYQLIGTLNQYDVDTLRKLHIACESWYHITKKGGYFGIHNHPMAAWSGVYCVSAGDKVEDDPDSGGLNFISPHISTTSFIDKSCSNLRGQFSRGNKLVHLQEGQLVLFPSWLLHEVKPYFGESDRITVAFNSWFKYSG
ncbi:TIGR02466 family protein [Kangiella sp.]|uniref:TIGR02466 family protein n=1 Tax=Kangiella sp. TaxID=1920245 RepID=UPI003A93B580